MTVAEFLTLVANNPQHTYFYHFTDRKNLAKIIEHGGLLPTQTLRAKGIAIPAPGGDNLSMDLDRYRGMDAYVHLSFTRGNPMAHVAINEGRITDIVYLRICPSVLTFPNVKISDRVANSNDAIIRDVGPGIDNLDTQIIYTHTNWNDPVMHARLDTADRCEILVPQIIPLNLIQKPNGL